MDPIISVITIVKDDKEGLKKTIDSVLSQNFGNFEYLVVDGKSSDGSLELAKKYKGKIKVYGQEDNGIYDAMNRGIKLAKGKIVNFLNAGDTFYDSNVLGLVSNYYQKNPCNVISGKILYSSPFYKEPIVIFKTTKNLHRGISLNHQATFVENGVLNENPFDDSFKSAADFDLFCRLYKQNYSFGYMDKIIARYHDVGNSSQQYVLGVSRPLPSLVSEFESLLVVKKHYGLIPAFLFSMGFLIGLTHTLFRVLFFKSP